MADTKKKRAVSLESVRETILAIQESRLDGRTTQAQALSKTRQALADAPEEAIKALLRHNVAVSAMIQNEVVRELQAGNMLTEDGRLPELVTKDLLRVQHSVVQSAGLLAQLEGIASKRWQKTISEMKRGDKRNNSAAVILDTEGGMDGADRG